MSLLDKSANKAQLIEILNSMHFPIMGAGGGFAPIGTENYFEGTTAPVGWVLCDGSVLNITDYPELATYYASHYGASNHFGGDGVTTFAVPTKEGMPENTDGVYGEQERVVGVWKETVDGVLKQKPVYLKVVDFGALPNNSTKSVAHRIDNLDFVVSVNMISANNAYALPIPYVATDNISNGRELWLDETNISVRTGKDSSSYVKTYVTVRYTKTTDSWTLPTLGHSADGNGVFCVKATVAGDPNAHQYSTEEQVVGKWIDGKDLYEKTIILEGSYRSSMDNIASLPSEAIPHFISGMGTVSGGYTPIHNVNPQYLSEAGLGVWINSSKQINLRAGTDTISRLEITIQYTKTS